MSASPTAFPLRRRVAPVQQARIDYREWIFRAVIVTLLLGSMVLAWWSIRGLAPLQKETRTLSSRVANLSAEVDDLERKRPRGQDGQVEAKLQEAHSTLFTDRAALAAWLATLQKQTTPLALNARSDFGKTIPQTTNGESVTVIPTTISLDVRPQSGAQGNESPYQRVLRLNRILTTQDKRADLRELTMVGGPQSVTNAVMVFYLWAGDKGVQ